MADQDGPALSVESPEKILEVISNEIGGAVPDHLRILADLAPSSVQGYYRLWRELMRDPEQGGALPKRYKALVCVALATTARNRDSAVFWSKVAIRWGLRLEELVESVGFNITGQGMSTFLDIGQHCVRAARDEAVKVGKVPAPDPIPPFNPPPAWRQVLLPTNDLPLAERPAQAPPGDEKQAEIHAYFERSFSAPMPEFWARLGRESTGILEGYYLLRRDTMRRPEEGGFTPKKVKELLAVAIDTVFNNPWGGEAHLRAAMVNGATLADVREIEGLVIMEVGMVLYKLRGFDFMVKAEEIAAAIDRAT